MIIDNFAHPEMLFTSPLDNYKDRSTSNTSFRCLLSGTEFDFLNFHYLRHSNATLFWNSALTLKSFSDHLEHSNINTTGNIYADVLNTSRRKRADH